MKQDAELAAPEREARELRRRALALAAPAPASEAADGSLDALEFSVAGQRCVLPLQWVREVRPLGGLLPVPLAPRPLLGLVSWRGRMLPVLALDGLLGGAAEASPPGRLLVVAGRGAVLGIAAAEVHGLLRIRPADAERRSEPLGDTSAQLVRGVTPEGHLLLDGERLLTLLPAATPAPYPPTTIEPDRP